MRIGTIFVVLAVVALTTVSAFGQTRALESFHYPLTTLAGLGTAGNGWVGPWATDVTGGTEGLVTICNNRFDYASLAYDVKHDTVHLQWTKSNAWSDANRYKRPLAAALPNTVGKVYWASYLVDFKDSLPVGNTYFMLKLYSGTTEIVALGHGGGGSTPAKFSCGSGWPGSPTNPDFSTTQIMHQPSWVVMRINMSGNGTDPCRTYMWVDPNPAVQPDTATAIVKRNSTVPAGGIDNVALEFGGDGILTRLIFDEIVVASSYADLNAATPAATVARESFNYPVTSLVGKGTATNGFGGAWINDANGTEGLVSICNTRFDYANLAYEIPHDTIHLQWNKSLAWSDANRYKRPLVAAYPNTLGKSYWLSYMVEAKDSLPVGNTYFMVKLFSSTTEIVALGHGGGGSTPAMFSCGSGWPGSPSNPDFSTTQITRDPAWLVMRINMSGNATDPCRTYMWVNPNPAVQPDTASAVVKHNSTVPVAGIDNIALEFGGDMTCVRLIFDEICFAPTYAGLTTTGVAEQQQNLPTKFSLSQNYPNPFNPSTNITYTLAKSEQVRLSVFNILGQEVAVLANGVQNPGEHTATFNGNGLTSGVYFYRLQSASNSATLKMMMVK